MPFRETSIMDQRREFVALAERGDIPFAELCRRFEVSRPTGYKWLGRFRASGDAGLAEQSRRPHTSPGRTPAAVEARVVALRDAHPRWGGQKLRTRLRDQGLGGAPAASTVTAILGRHGRLDPAESAKHTAWRRFEHAAPNDLWQLDFKGHFPLGAGRCHPLSVLDDHSRYLLGLAACGDEQDGTVRAVLTQLFRRYGLPWRILTDNGPPWGSPGQDLTALGVWLLRLGVRPVHGRPLHPETQGKVERFHRTLKAEVLRGAAAYPDLAGAQAAFAGWRETYNHERPHHALGMAVPASRYRPSTRPFPEALPPLEYGPDASVRVVARGGQVQYRNRVVFVSQALAGQRVAVRPTTTDGIMAVYFGQAPLGTVDLHQPTPVLDRTAAQPVVAV